MWLQLYHSKICCRWVGMNAWIHRQGRTRLNHKESADRTRWWEQCRDKGETERTNRILIGHLYKLVSAALWHKHSNLASAQIVPNPHTQIQLHSSKNWYTLHTQKQKWERGMKREKQSERKSDSVRTAWLHNRKKQHGSYQRGAPGLLQVAEWRIALTHTRTYTHARTHTLNAANSTSWRAPCMQERPLPHIYHNLAQGRRSDIYLSQHCLGAEEHKIQQITSCLKPLWEVLNNKTQTKKERKKEEKKHLSLGKWYQA